MKYFILLLSVCSLARATTPEEAQAVLAEKQAQRDRARAVIVQISTGELDDLKMRINLLQLQVDALKGQKSQTSSQVSQRHDEIEIGMTKAEVRLFVNQHKDSMVIVSISATNGISKAYEQINVNESGNANVKTSGRAIVRKGREQEDVAGKGRKTEIDSNGQAENNSSGTKKIEVITNSGKHEIMTIAKFVNVRRQTGFHANPIGGGEAVYQDSREKAGEISVVFDDEVVTSFDAR